ncbi:MAG: hypothetical protein IPI11_17405 [Haliscomenobacter sp.]|nr:hypothetical protein [Haliscomenobacter sp.]
MKLLSIERSAKAQRAIRPIKQTKKNLFEPVKKGFQELGEFSGIILGMAKRNYFAEKAKKKSI